MKIPLPSLRCLELLESIPNRSFTESLRTTPLLESLTLVWPENWPFPMADLPPELRTLRLNIVPHPNVYASPERPCSCHLSISSITTLQIVNFSDADWPDKYWLKSKFPNLRVFNLQNTEASPRPVFDFVQRHPTILEVNIHFIGDADVRLEAILKLIDGTGTWLPPEDLETYKEPGDPRCFYITTEGKKKYLDTPEMDEMSPITYPDDIPNTRYASESFAFKRVPLTPEATTWGKRDGSPHPRYQATEFAILLSDQDYLEFSGRAFGHFHDFFLLADKFPVLQVLRVMSGTHIPMEYTFEEYIVRTSNIASLT